MLSLRKNPTNCRDVDFANEDKSNMTKKNSGSGRREAPRLSVKERRSKGLAHQDVAKPNTSKQNNEQRTFAPSFLEGSVADQTLEAQALQTYELGNPEVDHFANEIPTKAVEHITNEMFSLNNQLIGAQRAINDKIILFCAPLLAINAWIGIWVWI